MGKIPLSKKAKNRHLIQARKFKTINDSNLAEATKDTYNRYFNQLFAWSDETKFTRPFPKIPNPATKNKRNEKTFDTEKGQALFLEMSDRQLQDMLEQFLEYQKLRVDDDTISPNSVPKFFKPYKYLLEANYREHAVKWKPLKMMMPKKEKRSGFRPWNSEQIDELVQVVSSFKGSMAMHRNKAAILFHASTGSRVGVHNDALLCKHMVKMIHPGLDYHCYAILIYATFEETIAEKDQRILTEETDDQDYSKFVFLTPEAARAVDEYHQYRAKNGETLDGDSPIFSIVKEFDNRIPIDYRKQMSGNAFRHLMEYALAKSSIIRQKKRNRYSTMIDHGYRKRYNTILKLNKDINTNIAEALMQHARGMDGSYLKPTREECFAEFIKAISELTIKSEMHLKNKVARQNQIIEEKDEIIQNQLKKIEENGDILAKEIRKQTSIKSEDDIRELIGKMLEEKGL